MDKLLESSFKIVAPHGELAARVLVSSGRYAGYLSDTDEFLDEADNARKVSTEASGAGGAEQQGLDKGGESRSRDADVTGRADLIRIPMPGSDTHVMIPDQMSPEEADRIKSWIELLVKPAIDFAGGRTGRREAK